MITIRRSPHVAPTSATSVAEFLDPVSAKQRTP